MSSSGFDVAFWGPHVYWPVLRHMALLADRTAPHSTPPESWAAEEGAWIEDGRRVRQSEGAELTEMISVMTHAQRAFTVAAHLLPYLMPCAVCRRSCKVFLSGFPPHRALRQGHALRWVWRLHQLVSSKLGRKDALSYKSFLRIALAEESVSGSVTMRRLMMLVALNKYPEPFPERVLRGVQAIVCFALNTSHVDRPGDDMRDWVQRYFNPTAHEWRELGCAAADFVPPPEMLGPPEEASLDVESLVADARRAAGN